MSLVIDDPALLYVYFIINNSNLCRVSVLATQSFVTCSFLRGFDCVAAHPYTTPGKNRTLARGTTQIHSVAGV